MSFEIVNETYVTPEEQDPKRWGYIEGYTSNTVGETFLRLNINSIPDQEMYDYHKKIGVLDKYEYKVGQPYGEGIRMNRKQVCQSIWELIKWIVRGW